MHWSVVLYDTLVCVLCVNESITYTDTDCSINVGGGDIHAYIQTIHVYHAVLRSAACILAWFDMCTYIHTPMLPSALLLHMYTYILRT